MKKGQENAYGAGCYGNQTMAPVVTDRSNWLSLNKIPFIFSKFVLCKAVNSDFNLPIRFDRQRVELHFFIFLFFPFLFGTLKRYQNN